MTSPGRWLALAAVLAAASPVPVRSQASGSSEPAPAGALPIDPAAAPRPALAALRLTDPIRIDGVLDEPAWLAADSATGFITALPRAGYPAGERSVARVLYDATHLYVGAYLYDSQPERLFSPGLEQDFETHDADLFGVVLDTFLDRQNGVMFAVNPAGALFDAQAFNDSREVNRAWEGVIETRTRVHPDGWSVEMAIPLRTLRFRAAGADQAWGLNFVRRVRRLNEDSYWAPLERQFRVHKMSQAGTLTGLAGLRQGRNINVKPYVSTGLRSAAARATGTGATDADIGFDIKYGITSRLTLDLTALTDFSQVEADQEQVNLTRFSLFFPEKRDFFLENDGIFSFGDITERNYRTGSGPRDFKLFYSRSIGLSADRRPLPILGGARLSGRVGATEIGVLDMQTRTQGTAPAENFSVLRLRQNFGPNANAGIMAVNRQATDEDGAYDRALGLDANLRLLRYLLLNSYVAVTAASQEDSADVDPTSVYLQAAWRDRLWDASAFVKHVGDGFHPEAGFIRRRGVRQAFATAGAHPQPRLPHVAELNPYVDVSAIENLDGLLETRWIEAGLGASFLDGGTLSVTHENRFERLFEPTQIGGALLAPGAYRFAETAIDYQASGGRRVFGGIRAATGSFYDGERTSVSGRLGLRPNVHIGVEAFAEYNDVRLAGTAVRADVFGARLRYAASTRVFASALVQYVGASDELLSNIRFNFIHAPLSDLFVVLSERRPLNGAAATERYITVKATRLLAF